MPWTVLCDHSCSHRNSSFWPAVSASSSYSGQSAAWATRRSSGTATSSTQLTKHRVVSMVWFTQNGRGILEALKIPHGYLLWLLVKCLVVLMARSFGGWPLKSAWCGVSAVLLWWLARFCLLPASHNSTTDKGGCEGIECSQSRSWIWSCNQSSTQGAPGSKVKAWDVAGARVPRLEPEPKQQPKN